MKNYRAVLGVPDSAGGEEIKKAYRSLAMKHHPDRGGDTAAFQAINEAYAALEGTGFAFDLPRAARQQANWNQPESPSGTWRDATHDVPPPNQGWNKPQAPGGSWRNFENASDNIEDIIGQMKSTKAARNPNYVQQDIIMAVPIREAMRGFEWRISRQKQNGFVEHLDAHIPAGLPDGHRGRYTLSDGSTQVLIMQIEAGDFKLRSTSKTVGTIFEAGITTGDVELDVSLDAIDLITGTWFEVHDFLGEKLTVRVPAGFNPDQRLKVAGKGYAGWLEDQLRPANFRRDMYIKVRPVWNSPDKISRQKVLNLYNAVGDWEKPNES